VKKRVWERLVQNVRARPRLRHSSRNRTSRRRRGHHGDQGHHTIHGATDTHTHRILQRTRRRTNRTIPRRKNINPKRPTLPHPPIQPKKPEKHPETTPYQPFKQNSSHSVAIQYQTRHRSNPKTPPNNPQTPRTTPNQTLPHRGVGVHILHAPEALILSQGT
jgi:hypothetical protein